MFSALKRFFNKALKKLWKMFKIIMTRELERFMAEILDYALSVITNLMNQDMSTSDKRRVAFDRIKAEAIERGINYRDSWIGKVIEDCVIAVKLEF